MPLNEAEIRDQIATIDQVVRDLIYRNSLSPGELENFLDLLSPLVAELDQVRGDVLVDLNAQISRLRTNEDAINDLKEEIQDFSGGSISSMTRRPGGPAERCPLWKRFSASRIL